MKIGSAEVDTLSHTTMLPKVSRTTQIKFTIWPQKKFEAVTLSDEIEATHFSLSLYWLNRVVLHFALDCPLSTINVDIPRNICG